MRSHDVGSSRPLLLALVLSALSLSVGPVLGGTGGADGALQTPAAEDAMSTTEALDYVVSLPEQQTQMVEVSLRIPAVSPPHVEVALPTWRPGRYVIFDPAATVRDLRAEGRDGGRLPVDKVDKSTWRIDVEEVGEVTVHYRLYANSLGDRTRHVDDTHAFLSGESVFLYLPERRDAPLTVRVEAPDDWRVATGLEPVADAPDTYAAPNYDVLADSPLEIGLHEVMPFEVRGVPHEIVIWGEADADPDRLVEDLTAIVEEQSDLFGEMPYERYVFMIHAGAGASGGTEHLNSTIMQVGREALEDRERYRERFLGLAAHEMFHTWNVKRLRPAGLKPYDYSRENYTRLLWVAEGTTSYYDEVTLARTGLASPEEYLSRLAEAIGEYRRRPGRAVQSLADSSFDAWIRYGRTNPDDVNSSVSFYRKGALVSLLLDLEIRRRTDNRASLDQVMRTLYRRFPLEGPGYTTEDLRSVVEKISGSDFERFFDRFVRGTEELPLEESLETAGLELALRPSSVGDGNGDDPADDEPAAAPTGSAEGAGDPPDRAYLGVDVGTDDGRPVVLRVRSDGPAYAAGLMPGDRLLAIDDRQLEAGDLEERLRDYTPGDRIDVTLFRYGLLRTLEVVLASRPDAEWTIRHRPDATPEQIDTYETWLRTSWPG